MNKKLRHQLNPSLSADCVIFGFDGNDLKVLLIERSLEFQEKMLSTLPGDLIYEHEDLEVAAHRILNELTGIQNIFLEQLGAFGNIDRLDKESDKKWLHSIRTEPEKRVVTVAFYSLVNIHAYSPQPSSFAKAAKWVSVKEVEELGFDHLKIFQSALNKLKLIIKIQPIGFNLLPEKFTLTELNKLYEAILCKPLDKRNFRRKMLKLKIIEPLQEKQKGVAHKPSRYFQFNETTYNQLVNDGFDNYGF